MRQKTKVRSWYELRMRTKSDTPGGPDEFSRFLEYHGSQMIDLGHKRELDAKRGAVSYKKHMLKYGRLESADLSIVRVTRYRLAPLLVVGPFRHRAARPCVGLGQKW